MKTAQFPQQYESQTRLNRISSIPLVKQQLIKSTSFENSVDRKMAPEVGAFKNIQEESMNFNSSCHTQSYNIKGGL